MKLSYHATKYVCYYTYLAMSSVFCLPPILFTTFREMYGISYTLLGTLILTNFCTQLAIDLVFSFWGSHFNPHTAVRITPLLTGVGLMIYALTPMLFPDRAYAGLLMGTIVFSLAAGLGEVLISPTVAALPSPHPEKDMAALHSLYGYGVVMVVVLSTIFLELFGTSSWMYLVLLWAILPVIASILLFRSPLPKMDISHADDVQAPGKRNTGILLCMLCIFFGSAAENSMTNWVSTYIEGALRIPKAVGDILGLTLFAVLLALTRSWYAKYGKNIYRVLLVSMSASVICYLAASLSPSPVISMIACVLTGIFTSMLWPGTLILMEEQVPSPGVAAYALMAAGGDFGASIAPQALGVIVDTVAASGWVIPVSASLSISPEQIGMKVGMLIAAVFPMLGVGVLLYMRRCFHFPKKQKETAVSSAHSL